MTDKMPRSACDLCHSMVEGVMAQKLSPLDYVHLLSCFIASAVDVRVPDEQMAQTIDLIAAQAKDILEKTVLMHGDSPSRQVH